MNFLCVFPMPLLWPFYKYLFIRCIFSVSFQCFPFYLYLFIHQMYLLCSLAIFSMPLLWPSLPAHRAYTLSIPILLPIAHMGLTGKSLYDEMESESGTVLWSVQIEIDCIFTLSVICTHISSFSLKQM